MESMAKFKPVKNGPKKPAGPSPQAQGAIPCLIIIAGLVLVSVVFYGVMTSSR
jgi:hypothetical protein